jgi:hypothetical protein
VTDEQHIAALREEIRRAGRGPSSQAARSAVAVGLLEHAALIGIGARGVFVDLRHPTDMPFGLVYGGAVLVCALFSLLCAAATFLWVRSAEGDADTAVLAAGIGMIVAPIAGYAAFIAVVWVLLLGLQEGVLGMAIATGGAHLLAAATVASCRGTGKSGVRRDNCD